MRIYIYKTKNGRQQELETELMLNQNKHGRREGYIAR